ncbi:GNAT family N-acetyltransferase [Vibrio sp. Of7-15]|uniref:GNAT family N-acetyltransferase n=1 Tax=Vibrio sp. Of7-15 TaxID=2724879 RepID=UPI001EF23F2A|nr:GNAT family N-acetyltransferase [Vibrio sp. Of7-15]
MDLIKFNVEKLKEEHISEVTELWRTSMEQAIRQPPIHAFDSQAYFLQHILTKSHDVRVVVEVTSSKPIAFIASNSYEVSQLYVGIEFQQQGIGAYLLNLAKSYSSGSLTLRTFEVNKKAQVFYERHGFIAGGGNTENEEGLQDIEYRWIAQ